MFKKVLQSISKSLGKPSAPAPAPAPAAAPRAEAQPPARQSPPPAPASKAAPAPAKAAPAPAAQPRTVEEQLGIDPKMNKDQIRDHLKLLYRRYNRAASSLDNATRSEADAMLDAIVAVREKNFGEI